MAQPIVITNRVVRGMRSLARMGCDCVEFIGLDALTAGWLSNFTGEGC